MQNKKTDFKQFLNDLLPKITSYTQIHLHEINQTLIHFTIRWIITHKHKNYKINCSINQIQTYITHLSEHILKYPIKKVSLTKGILKNINFFRDICFDEIIYQQNQESIQSVLKVVFNQIIFKKLSFNQFVTFQIIKNITLFIHKQFSHQDIHLDFKISHYDKQDIISYLSLWGNSLPQISIKQIQPIQQSYLQHKIIKDNKTNSSKRREQIRIIFQQTQLFTLRHLDTGIQLIYKKQISQEYLKQIIQILIKLNKFTSLQLQQMQEQSLLNLIKLILQQFKQKYYRIIVGNQIQLTSNRFLFNTNGFNKNQVKNILKLMRLPGHYQFICYSTTQHFQAAFQLFKNKPLIKFNFFLPLEEVQPLKELINKMDQHAKQLLLKVYSYAGLIKKLANQGYLAVNTIFYSLGERP